MSGFTYSESSVPIPEGFTPFPNEKVNRSVAELLQESCEYYADKIAIEVDDRKISFRELDCLTNQLANSIVAQIGDKEEPVAILTEQGVSQIIAILGVLKSGKIYSVMDLSNPPERLANLLVDFGAHLIVSNSSNFALARSVVDESVSVIDMDKLTGSNEKILVPRSADDLVAVYYTSGSTGQPKGVVYKNRSILHFMRTVTNRYCMNPDDKQTLPFSCSYAWSISPTFATLLCGGTLYPIDLRRMSMQELAAFVEENQITILQLSTGMLRSFMSVLEKNKRHFPHLKILVAGGEPMQAQDAQLWKTLFSPPTVLGCTLASSEATLITFNTVSHDSDIPQGIFPVGFPVPYTEVLIVDEERRPLPYGEAGEVAIRSEYLANGYWNKPELTDAFFQKDVHDPSKRIFYSGDLGRFLPDGKLEYLGRKDSFVKIRAYSVDLLEVEQAIYDLHYVKHVVVMAMPARHDPEQKQLVAYLVMDAKASRDAVQLREALAKKLPSYMIPSFFVFLDSMPLTINGKVDKKSLPPMDFSREPNPADMPADDIERRLLIIWQNILKQSNIGINDSFFSLGGDSLLAMDLLLSIEKAFLKKMPLTIILNASTIKQQADILRNGDEVKMASVIPVKSSGGKPPIFWIPSGFGVDLYVQGMAKHLNADQPLYLLSTPDAPKEQFFLIEELAKIYAGEIRQFLPDGPYYLMGHSGGGTIACETANELIRFGGKIGWVGLLDTVPPQSHSITLLESFKLFIRNISFLGFLRSLKDLGRNIFIVVAMSILQVQWIRENVLKIHKIPFVKFLGTREAAYVKVFFAHRPYNPMPFAFDLIVFKANGIRRYSLDDFMPNWNKYAAKDLKYVDVPGDHVSIMEEPNIAVLASKICEQVAY